MKVGDHVRLSEAGLKHYRDRQKLPWDEHTIALVLKVTTKDARPAYKLLLDEPAREWKGKDGCKGVLYAYRWRKL
jgi:hypothetical protein